MSEFLFDDVGLPTTTRQREYRPRPYQFDADAAAAAALASADACGIYMATGLGKTEVSALLIQRDEWPRAGKVILTPRRELVVQSADRFRSRGIPCGIEMAAERSDEIVTVGCYQSFQSRRRYERYLGTTGLLIVDESHLNYTPAAIRMINHFKEWGAKVVGMTATPATGKKDPLAKTYGSAAFVYDYLKGQADGWLVPAKIYMTVMEDLDLSEWRESWIGTDDEPADGKPKTTAQVAKMLARKSNVTAVCSMVAEYWEGLPSVVFAMSIDHAEEIQKELILRGIPTAVVHSRMDDHERRLHLDMFEDGRAGVIVNVGCLTLGWDSPRVRKLFIARPTKSQALYIQMFGRATRCEPGLVDRYDTAEARIAAIAASSKPFMEVFDFTDTSRQNDLKSAMDVLYPTINDRLLRRIRNRMPRILTTNAATEIDPILQEEAKLLAAEEAEQARLEYERRAHLVGTGRFSAYERSIHADAEQQDRKKVTDYWWMPYGRFKGRSFKNIPVWYLRSILPHVKHEGLARNIRKFLSVRS